VLGHPHELRLAQAAWQSGATEVEAAVRDEVVPYGAVVHLRFPSALVAVEVHWCTHIPPDRTEILMYGTAGTAQILSVFGNSPDRPAASDVSLCVTSEWSGTVALASHGTAAEEYDRQHDALFEDLEAADVWPDADHLRWATAALERASSALERTHATA
jgi:hypothetical protein